MNPNIPKNALKFDFHMHTLDDPMDHHVFHTVEELIDLAASKNYGALSITLHGQQFQKQSVTDYAAEKGILLIPGVEQDIEGSHVLLINFPPEISASISTFAQLAEARKILSQNPNKEFLVIAPHPFFPSSVSLIGDLEAHADCFDAIEVSGFFHQFWNPNRKAIALAQKLSLPLVGNSDTHTLEQFGKTWSEVHCDKDVNSILRAIKENKVVVRGRSLAFHEMGIIGYKVIARGYMKWINYKRKRNHKVHT